MVTTPARYLFATPKTCRGCQRMVFAVDEVGDCPGCQRSRPQPAYLT